MSDTTIQPDNDFDSIDDDIDDGDAEMNCGLEGSGHCSLAGTEWCDWSCPFADEAYHNRRLKKPAEPKQGTLL